MPSKTRTMYLHTLDDQPANYTTYRGQPYVYFVGGRYRAKLVSSLGQIRREQAAAKAQDRIEGRAPDHFRYGYVLVEVPS